MSSPRYPTYKPSGAEWLGEVPGHREVIGLGMRRIVAHCSDTTTRLDTLTTEAERAIALLRERRAALITAAVTGQIDVRGLAPEVPA